MKQGLQLKLSQHLTLTPQLQQAIRLLQLSTLELDQELELILQTNPLLEQEDHFDSPDLIRDEALVANQTDAQPDTTELDNSVDDFSELSWQEAPGYSGGDEDETYENQTAQAALSLREHLLWQIRMSALTARDLQWVEVLIDALDERGYLTQSLDEISSFFPEEAETVLEELNIALKHVQHLDPAGVGARDISECLLLQLNTWQDEGKDTLLAQAIIQHELTALSTHDFAGIQKRLRCDAVQMRQAHELIMQLNPRPGAAFGVSDTRYIIPDVVVAKTKGVWTVKLNRQAMPRLRINPAYAAILARDGDNPQMVGQMQEAKWLIKNISQRFDTILRVAQSIVERQHSFFEHGEVAMRPMVLREIADLLNLHESTISRVTTQKYMMTPRGIFEFKYFFGSSVSTELGGACSATAIRALIKQMVATENTQKPLSDGKMSQALGEQGIVVARRTVAKYREALHIPPATQRKAL